MFDLLRLQVVPIANLISYCEASWKEVLKEHENDYDFKGAIIQNDPQWCSGRTYVKSIKRVLCSEEIGILVLGTLKVRKHGIFSFCLYFHVLCMFTSLIDFKVLYMGWFFNSVKANQIAPSSWDRQHKYILS